MGSEQGHVELTSDPQFARRVVRLALTSVVALGFVWYQSGEISAGKGMIQSALLAGWILMPTVLLLSLRWPLLRYATVVPATLVSVALLAICFTALPDPLLARAGWLMTTSGVLMGAGLGVWFWFRWLPVPEKLSEPFSRGRWALIVVHVALIVVGVTFVGISQTT